MAEIFKNKIKLKFFQLLVISSRSENKSGIYKAVVLNQIS